MIVPLIGAITLCLWFARPSDVRSGLAPAEASLENPEVQASEAIEPESYGLCPQQYPVTPPYAPGSPHRAVTWDRYPGPDMKPDGDLFWKARYTVYQDLITYWSSATVSDDDTETMPVEGSPFALLHGRSDVLDNATLILDVALAYPEIPAILVAASIAQQASDIERVFGVDALEQIALTLPGLDDMSIGIAQLRPTETDSLGLGDVNLFEPEIAIHGMFSKIAMGRDRIDALQSPTSAVPATDRAMLLSLAQNSPHVVDAFFAAGGDWGVILDQGNNQRVMRYFLVHLDWLVESGWELPGDVDLERWRAIVFSAPRAAHDE